MYQRLKKPIIAKTTEHLFYRIHVVIIDVSSG